MAKRTLSRPKRGRRPVVSGKRVTRRTSSKKRKAPKARKGSFKKARKLAKPDVKSAKRHYDDFGTLTRQHVLYMGFEAHGSKERMWSIIAEAITKELLMKMKIYPRSYDDPFTELTMYDRILLRFRAVNVPTGVDKLQEVTLTINPTLTLKTLSALVQDQLVFHGDVGYHYEPNPTTLAGGGWVQNASTLTHSAMYLDGVTIYNNDSADYHRIVIKDIGESKLSLSASQLIKMHNLTPNNNNGVELDVMGTNPLSGMKYEFKNHRAKVISEIQKLSTEYDMFQGNSKTGYHPGFQVSSGSDRVGSPPKARNLFLNCSGSTGITMGAGAFKSERTSFKMENKLSTFIERIYYSGFDKGNWGGVTWFGFERAIRQVPDASHTGEDSIKISWNRELHMAASIKFKVQKTSLKHYERPEGVVVAS